MNKDVLKILKMWRFTNTRKSNDQTVINRSILEINLNYN